jgi:hypothetical protein
VRDDGRSWSYVHSSGVEQHEPPQKELEETRRERLRQQLRQLPVNSATLASMLPMRREEVHPTKSVINARTLLFASVDELLKGSPHAHADADVQVLLLEQREVQAQRLARVESKGRHQHWLPRAHLLDVERKKAPIAPRGYGWANLEYIDGRKEVPFWRSAAGVLNSAPAGSIAAGSAAVLLAAVDEARQVAWGGMIVWVQRTGCYLDCFHLPLLPREAKMIQPVSDPSCSPAPVSGATGGTASLMHADLRVNARDTALPDNVPLPFDDARYWQRVLEAYPEGAVFAGPDCLAACMQQYGLGGPHLDAGMRPSVRGLHAVTAEYGREHPSLISHFYAHSLPFIVRQMRRLPTIVGARGLPFLRQGERHTLVLERPLVVSLLAHAFLCTFDRPFLQVWQTNTLNLPSFKRLFAQQASQEVAKLAMFMHAWNCLSTRDLAGKGLIGSLIIERVVGSALTGAEWRGQQARLQPLTVAKHTGGFEKDAKEAGPKMAHADFANMYIGGGVFWGGCVQEEIRFSMCPELCVALIMCPVLMPEEALQTLG